MIAVLVSSNMKVSPIGYHGVGADREGANTDDGGWGGVEAETAWRELVEPAQVFHDRDASRQQRGVHRACRAAGVVDVDRVDADQCGLLLDQPAGGGSGEERVLGAVAVAAPVAVPAGMEEHGPACDVMGGQSVPVDRAARSINPHHYAV